MRNQLVYDLPTRFFHWLFAGLFLTAFSIAKLIDSETTAFTYHMIAGLTLTFVVLLRIVWGIKGTQHARFSSFALNPKDLFGYMKGFVTGAKRRWAGHNPASSWAALVMMALALALGTTGVLMTGSDQKEVFEDIHELMANTFAIIVILHVVGIALHMLRYRDGIALSMIDGDKDAVPPADVISNPRRGVGLLFLGLTLAFALLLVSHYDTSTRALNVFGLTLQLGEAPESD